MKDIRISTAAQVHYKFNGFFEAGSPDWIHMSRELMENELIIVTNGTLSIADETDRYVVNENEYLIMEPGQQFGFAPSLCTFYWLHFDCLFFGFKDEPVIFLPKQGQISSPNRIHNAFWNLIMQILFTMMNKRIICIPCRFYWNCIISRRRKHCLVIPTVIIYCRMSKTMSNGIRHTTSPYQILQNIWVIIQNIFLPASTKRPA